MAILSVNHISKTYGRVQALKDVSFAVPKGSVFGVLGPNGSGKTTLLAILVDVIKASGGGCELFEQTPSAQTRQRMGTFLETPNFYHYLNARENLGITAAIRGHGKADIDRVLKLVNLEQRQDSKFSTYSLGMKQRLAIAACLLGDPELLILDEPTNGLDPSGIAETRELIKSLHREGKTIIMASHMLDEVEKVCSHVAILLQGSLIACGHVDEILVNDEIVEVGAIDLLTLERELRSFPNALSVKPSGAFVHLHFKTGAARPEEINRFCMGKGIALDHLCLRKKTLEAKFFELTATN